MILSKKLTLPNDYSGKIKISLPIYPGYAVKPKIVKSLKWIHRKSDNVIYANPSGMRYGYYIKPTEENKYTYELAYVENNGDFKEHGIIFNSLESAQNVAIQHYQKQVLAHILPELLK